MMRELLVEEWRGGLRGSDGAGSNGNRFQQGESAKTMPVQSRIENLIENTDVYKVKRIGVSGMAGIPGCERSRPMDCSRPEVVRVLRSVPVCGAWLTHHPSAALACVVMMPPDVI
ncbi:hypothetical protein ACLBKS_02450 [Hylemonella sp. W303a]|uniref:hypothetical protein n=1 Tax=Hylemonella sp. W303a TaxID=3389873 RepID=UPI00396B2A14